jgi:hypothetical protein
MVMVPVIRDLQRKGFRVGGHEIGAFSFADDIVLLADSIDGAQDPVDQFGCYMNKVGMTIHEYRPPSSSLRSGRPGYVGSRACQ